MKKLRAWTVDEDVVLAAGSFWVPGRIDPRFNSEQDEDRLSSILPPSMAAISRSSSRPAPGAGAVTQLLRLWRSGDAQAFDTLMPLVYDELRRMARRHLAHERQSHTLQPTAIVHEAYLRLVQEEGRDWQNRAHFFAAAAAAMRRILVDYARRRAAKKRGGDGSPYQLESGIAEPKTVAIIAVDDALQKLAELDPEQARVVELRFFAGLTEEEAAAALDISPATVRRRWQGARTWLHRELAAGQR